MYSMGSSAYSDKWPNGQCRTPTLWSHPQASNLKTNDLIALMMAPLTRLRARKDQIHGELTETYYAQSSSVSEATFLLPEQPDTRTYQAFGLMQGLITLLVTLLARSYARTKFAATGHQHQINVVISVSHRYSSWNTYQMWKMLLHPLSPLCQSERIDCGEAMEKWLYAFCTWMSVSVFRNVLLALCIVSRKFSVEWNLCCLHKHMQARFTPTKSASSYSRDSRNRAVKGKCQEGKVRRK